MHLNIQQLIFRSANHHVDHELAIDIFLCECASNVMNDLVIAIGVVDHVTEFLSITGHFRFSCQFNEKRQSLHWRLIARANASIQVGRHVDADRRHQRVMVLNDDECVVGIVHLRKTCFACARQWNGNGRVREYDGWLNHNRVFNIFNSNSTHAHFVFSVAVGSDAM